MLAGVCNPCSPRAAQFWRAAKRQPRAYSLISIYCARKAQAAFVSFPMTRPIILRSIRVFLAITQILKVEGRKLAIVVETEDEERGKGFQLQRKAIRSEPLVHAANEARGPLVERLLQARPLLLEMQERGPGSRERKRMTHEGSGEPGNPSLGH